MRVFMYSAGLAASWKSQPMGNVSNRKVISRDYVRVGGVTVVGGLLVWVTAGTGSLHWQLQEARVASSAAH